jgi:thioredoxin 1
MVYTELNKETLIKLQSELYNRNSIILLKFSAKWCNPCKKIKPLCENYFSTMPDNVMIFDIDIDEHIDLYVQLKSKKMLKGVPTMMLWKPEMNGIERIWYVPDETVSGSDENEVKHFFDSCYKTAIGLQK